MQGLPEHRQRNTRAMAIAVILHVVVAVIVVQILTFGHGLPAWMRFTDRERPVEERLNYIATRETPPRVVPPVRRPPVQPTTEQPQLVAPSAPVATPPAAPPAAAPRDTGGGAPPGANGIGALDPNVRGVRPGYTDERLWRGAAGGGGGAGGFPSRGDRADGLDSIIANSIMAARDSLDSLARAQGKYGRAPGDWTKTGKNGDKWGWDQQGIRLGKVTIPNALLALLPLNAATAANMSGNMSRMDANRRFDAATADIQRMSARGMGDAEFRRVTREMDMRRDTERRERLRAPSASIAAPLKSEGSTSSSSGKSPPR